MFRGNKAISAQEVQQHLNLVSRDPRGAVGGAAARRFLLPVSECEFTFNAILDDLQRDQWPVPADHRYLIAVAFVLTFLAYLVPCAFSAQNVVPEWRLALL